MCDKCKELDDKIKHYRRIACVDQRTNSPLIGSGNWLRGLKQKGCSPPRAEIGLSVAPQLPTNRTQANPAGLSRRGQAGKMANS